MDAILVQSLLQLSTSVAGNDQSINTSRFKWNKRIMMYHEEPGLRSNASRHMTRNHSLDACYLERILHCRRVGLTSSLQSVDNAVSCKLMLNREEASHKGIAGPIEESRWEAVVLTDREPLPIVSGNPIKVWQL